MRGRGVVAGELAAFVGEQTMVGTRVVLELEVSGRRLDARDAAAEGLRRPGGQAQVRTAQQRGAVDSRCALELELQVQRAHLVYAGADGQRFGQLLAARQAG